MIGIQAMSVIAGLTGNTEDSQNFSSIAHDYITQWQTLGIAHDANPPHSTLSYGQNGTWGKIDDHLNCIRSVLINLILCRAVIQPLCR